MTNKKTVNKATNKKLPIKKSQQTKSTQPKSTNENKRKRSPVVKVNEIDKSVDVNVVVPVEQSEIKTVISKSPKVEVYLETKVSEIHESLEPIKVSEVVLTKQEEKSYDCCKVDVKIKDRHQSDYLPADKIGYSIEIKQEKVSFFKRILNKIKSIF